MSDELWRRQEIESPCIRICLIHPDAGLCVGCLRSRDEIAAWSQMGAETRARITAALPARKSQLPGRRGAIRCKSSGSSPVSVRKTRDAVQAIGFGPPSEG